MNKHGELKLCGTVVLGSKNEIVQNLYYLT
jgi:hypothetical protein